MKYKIGDIVRVKEGLKGGNKYGDVYFNTQMEQYCGKIYKIVDFSSYCYQLEGCSGWCNKWEFSDDMVEGTLPIALKDIDFKVDAIYKTTVGDDIYIIIKNGKMEFTKDTALSTSTKLSLINYKIKKLNELVEEDGGITDRKVKIISDIIDGDIDLRPDQVEYFKEFQNLKNLIVEITSIYDTITGLNILLKSDFYSVEE